MKFVVGVVNAGLGVDPAEIRVLAQRLESVGFDGLSTNDHVVGGSAERVAGENVYESSTPVDEPLTFLSFVAAVTERLELSTGILLLPQRQTALVAKQCAQLDHLSGGRLRLGVGVGRNWMEYEALNEDFHNRGKRIEEQVEVLRRFWTQDHVTFEGNWHQLDRVGINPAPVQKPIPIWMGSFYGKIVERVLERIGRMADGWMPQFPPDELGPVLDRVRGYAQDAGRDPADLGIESVLRIDATGDPVKWVDDARAYDELGATHLKVYASGETPADVVRLSTRWLETVRSEVD